jgi:hypothetical protein
MKRTLAVASVTLSIGFIVALALSNPSNAATGESDMSQPGVAAQPESDMQTETGEKIVRDAEYWKKLRTCTDSKGVKYSRGQKGFDSCLSYMKKQSAKEQLGGEAAHDLEGQMPKMPDESSDTTDSGKSY